MYGLSGFEEKLNIKNWGNSIGNCVHYMYWLFGFTGNLNSTDMLNI